MAQRGFISGAPVSGMYQTLCGDCVNRGCCNDYKHHCREAIFASVNGYPLQCVSYQTERWRGLEGVRP
jgi:hypothetical protein